MSKFINSGIDRIIYVLLLILGFSSCARKHGIEKQPEADGTGSPILKRDSIRVIYGPSPTMPRVPIMKVPTDVKTDSTTVIKQ